MRGREGLFEEIILVNDLNDRRDPCSVLPWKEEHSNEEELPMQKPEDKDKLGKCILFPYFTYAITMHVICNVLHEEHI